MLITLVVVVALLAGDTRLRESSPALWIPVLWLLVVGSRFVSQWLGLGGGGDAAGSDGSPVDAACFGLLIVLGIVVLVRRRPDWAALWRANRWLAVFALYGLASVLWSEYPFTSFKRWIKALGHPVMALVVLTDPRPVEAVRIVLKRCAYVLLPASVLLIKYLPEYGRGYNAWTGEPTNHGVGLTKNDLGYLCMVSGLFFVWNALAAGAAARQERRREIALSLLFLALAGWLLYSARSATSLATLAIGAGTLLALRFGLVDKAKLGTWVVAAVVLAGIAELLFDPYARVIAALGRDPTLTDRTALWADVIALQPNLLFGAGFEGFWLGDRLKTLWDHWWWHPNQAHNGYLETWLNLGFVGIALLAVVIADTFRRIRAQLTPEFGLADFRIACLFAILAFNYTEAAFKGTHLVWTLFFLVAVERAGRHAAATQRGSVHAGPYERPPVYPQRRPVAAPRARGGR